MQAIILTGIQATGKSTFCHQRFFHTHLRLSLDMLNTRNKEACLLECCLSLQQRFVIDNTNPTAADRARYIIPAKERSYHIVGYYFQSSVQDAIARNAQRPGKACIEVAGILATHRRLELPTLAEGFDELHYVRIAGGTFEVTPWQDEI